MIRVFALLLAALLMLSGCSEAGGDSLPEASAPSVEELEAPQGPPGLPEALAEESATEESRPEELPLERPALTPEEAAELVKPQGEGAVWSISTPQELNAFAALVNAMDTEAMAATVRLESDLNLGGIDFIPIGSGGIGFIGSFDGGGHTITGLTVLGENDGVGLFGSIGFGGAVSNVHIIGGRICGGRQVGGIAGSSGGTITGCSFRGTVEAAGQSAGGICGLLAGGGEPAEQPESSPPEEGGDANSDADAPSEAGSGASASAQVARPTAGDLSEMSAGKLMECAANAQVSGHAHVGGLAGDVQAKAVVADCYALGSVTAVKGVGSETPNSVGGLCGAVSGFVTRCYASGEVFTQVSSKIVGGFVGLIDGGSVSDCYFNIVPVENWKEVGYSIGELPYDVTGCTVEEITEQSTFIGWDFTAVWSIAADRNRGLPFLRSVTGD